MLAVLFICFRPAVVILCSWYVSAGLVMGTVLTSVPKPARWMTYFSGFLMKWIVPNAS